MEAKRSWKRFCERIGKQSELLEQAGELEVQARGMEVERMFERMKEQEEERTRKAVQARGLEEEAKAQAGAISEEPATSI